MPQIKANKTILERERERERDSDNHIWDCSFGKDSMAMIQLGYEKNYPIDEVCYVKMMYDYEISAEYPEHWRFIQETGIPYIEDKLGLKFTELTPLTFKDLFFKVFQKGTYAGNHYGFPQRHCVKCNSELKVKVLKKHITEIKKSGKIPQEYVGIAADETKRVLKNKKYGLRTPLADWGITEREARRICETHGILSPIYHNIEFNRIGCFFCPNCTIPQLKYLWKTSPQLMEDLAKLDKYSPFKFHSPFTATQLLNRFKAEEKEQSSLSQFGGVKV